MLDRFAVDVPLTRALAWALVHFLWQGAALGLIGAILLRLARGNAAVRYGVGVATLACMAVAPAVTTAYLLRPAHPPSFEPVAVESLPGASSSTTIAALSSAPDARPVRDTAVAAQASSDVVSTPDVILAIWLTGVAVLSLRLLGGWVVARRLASRAIRPVAGDVDAVVRRIALRLELRRLVTVVESSAARVPMMIGWLKPAVLLPTAALSGLTPTQLEALIAHELAHVRRHDYLVNLLQSSVETLLFYHPMVWWISREVRSDRERCCDDVAVDVCDRLVYVTALADLAALTGGARLALAATDGSVLRRVRRLLGRPMEGDVPSVWVPAALAGLVVAVLIPVGLISAGAGAEGPGAPAAVHQTPATAPRATTPTPPASSQPGAPVPAEPTPQAAGAGVAARAHRGAPLTDEERTRVEAEIRRVQAEIEAEAGVATPAPPVPPPAPAMALPPPAPGFALAPPVAPAAPPRVMLPRPSVATPPPPAPPALARPAGQSGSGNMSWSDNGDKVSVKWTGSFRLSDDDKDIVWVEPGQTVSISDGGWFLTTGVEITGGANGTPEKHYYRASRSRDWEPEGRDFLAAALQKLVRRSGFGASDRVARFLKQGGVPAVLAEIDKLESDYVRRLYFTELLKQSSPSPAALTEVVRKATASIKSDYELASLLIAATKQAGGDERALAATADGTATIAGDYERHRVLSAVVAARLTQTTSTAVLKNAAAIKSDYEKASLLIEMVKQGGLTNGTSQAFFDRVREIKSSYEQGRVLRSVAAMQDPPAGVMNQMIKASESMTGDYERRQVLASSVGHAPQSTAGILDSAAGMRSDTERANVLVAIAKQKAVTAETAGQFFTVVSAMKSSYEQRRVLETVLAQPGLSPAVVTGLVDAAGAVASGYDRAEVLIRIARTCKLSATDRQAYLEAADGLKSDYDQTRVLAALVRAERGGTR